MLHDSYNWKDKLGAGGGCPVISILPPLFQKEVSCY